MFDIALRAQKDRLIDPLARLVPTALSPTHMTIIAFVCGLLSCFFAAISTSQQSFSLPSVSFWLLNRLLDSLDGAVARHRHQASDAGGFLDLLCDFTVYSLLPLAVTYGLPQDSSLTDSKWMAVAVLEATFHLNNFVLFYCAAVGAKLETSEDKKGKELTSLSMKPALIEGFESGVFFTLMLVMPTSIAWLSWIMAAGVAIGTVQRSWDLFYVLSNNVESGKEE